MDFGDAARADSDGRAEAYEAGRDERRGGDYPPLWWVLQDAVSQLLQAGASADDLRGELEMMLREAGK